MVPLEAALRTRSLYEVVAIRSVSFTARPQTIGVDEIRSLAQAIFLNQRYIVGSDRWQSFVEVANSGMVDNR